MAIERVNADFAERVVIATEDLDWVPSPYTGVERRLLDRIGGEVARATSLVRYAANSTFPAHDHAMGEEYLVLEGVFADEHGTYPVGTYVRNPPGSRHAPKTDPGCVIFVKLRQMPDSETGRVVIETDAAVWCAGDVAGHTVLPLHADLATGEMVMMEKLAAGVRLAARTCPDGEEVLVLSGTLSDEVGIYRAGTWLRNPPGTRRAYFTDAGATYWVKRGHLTPTLLSGVA